MVLWELFQPLTFALEFEWFFKKKMDRKKIDNQEYKDKRSASFVALFDIFFLNISDILLNTHTVARASIYIKEITKTYFDILDCTKIILVSGGICFSLENFIYLHIIYM
jgi:hypothetical protein